MKKIGTKAVVFFSILTALLLIGGCTGTESEQEISENEVNQDTEENKSIQLMDDITGLRSVTLQAEEEITLHYQQQEWASTDLEKVDQTAVNKFLTDILSLQGTATDWTDELEAAFQSPLLIIGLTGETDEKKVTFAEQNEIFFAVREDTNEVYQLDSIPPSVKNFLPSLLETSIPLAVETISEIVITQSDGKKITLNQETEMDKVETSAFLSGWFMHGPYETEFSVEYTIMETLLATLINLKGMQSEETSEIDQPHIVLELSDGENTESLIIGKKNEEGTAYLVQIDSHNELYEVPSHLIDQFSFEPLAIVDNFISLLPLSAIQKITIDDNRNDPIHITAEHELSEDENDEATIRSEFFVNENKVKEETFRKTYQYLAVLSYHAELNEQEKQIQPNEDTLQIRYDYQNDGETETNEIFLVPSGDDDTYIVMKNGISEFSVKKDDVDLMLDQFKKMIQ